MLTLTWAKPHFSNQNNTLNNELLQHRKEHILQNTQRLTQKHLSRFVFDVYTENWSASNHQKKLVSPNSFHTWLDFWIKVASSPSFSSSCKACCAFLANSSKLKNFWFMIAIFYPKVKNVKKEKFWANLTLIAANFTRQFLCNYRFLVNARACQVN